LFSAAKGNQFDAHLRCVSYELNKDQLSLTNLRDALHHGERAANKEGGHSV